MGLYKKIFIRQIKSPAVYYARTQSIKKSEESMKKLWAEEMWMCVFDDDDGGMCSMLKQPTDRPRARKEKWPECNGTLALWEHLEQTTVNGWMHQGTTVVYQCWPCRGTSPNIATLREQTLTEQRNDRGHIPMNAMQHMAPIRPRFRVNKHNSRTVQSIGMTTYGLTITSTNCHNDTRRLIYRFFHLSLQREFTARPT